MVSVERPSAIGTPQWNGPQQRQLCFALDTAEVEAYREKGFLILRDVFQPTEIEAYRNTISALRCWQTDSHGKLIRL